MTTAQSAASPQPTMAFRILDDLILLVHAKADPRDEEWSAFLAACPLEGKAARPSLVYTAGGRPTALQRKQLADVLRGEQPAVAIVSTIAGVRVVIGLVSWFNPNVRAFSPDQIAEALQYLKSRSLTAPQIQVELAAMKSQVGIR